MYCLELGIKWKYFLELIIVVVLWFLIYIVILLSNVFLEY